MDPSSRDIGPLWTELAWNPEVGDLQFGLVNASVVKHGEWITLDWLQRPL